MSFWDRKLAFHISNHDMLTQFSPGAAFISFGLPVLVYVLTFFCNDISGCPAPSLLSPSTLSWDQLKAEIGWTGFGSLLNWQGFVGTLGYYLLSLTLYAFLPADEVNGVALSSGQRLKYRFNGMIITWHGSRLG
jgi:delta14-sterol reductase